MIYMLLFWLRRFVDFIREKVKFTTLTTDFSSPPSTEGVESTRGNSVCLSVCLCVRNHFLDALASLDFKLSVSE